uniref:MGAT4 conserved region domain-containing protein n=1 Tax=Parascaris equorum TaxID=6256 RepID=A0A914S0F7_PAREQ
MRLRTIAVDFDIDVLFSRLLFIAEMLMFARIFQFSYLLPTLQSLISGMNAEERASTLLVVIVPPREWYPPDLRSIPATFDDSPERMYWRTKQNLDYIFLMLYCQRRGISFVSRIHDFTAQRPIESQWFMLEFSTLGFIGKLFRSSDLPLLAQFIALFHREKPVDWLLDLLFVNRYCHPEKSPKQCSEITKQYRVRSRPSLFQHVGLCRLLFPLPYYLFIRNARYYEIGSGMFEYVLLQLFVVQSASYYCWFSLRRRNAFFKNSGNFDRIVAFNEHGTARVDFNVSRVIDSLKIV